MRVYDQAGSGAVLRARWLRRDSTDAERRLLRALRSKLPQFKWRHQMPIGPYFADLACFSEKLVVELDGGQHADAAEHDAARTRFIQAQGFRVLRFWNNEALSNTNAVVEQIFLSLGSAKVKGQPGDGGAGFAQPSSPSHAPRRAGPSLSQGRGEKAAQ